MGSERGIYAYETAQGTRFYFKYRSANGRSATKLRTAAGVGPTADA